MLPKELLDVRKIKGRILPKFSDERDYELAEKVIWIFRRGVGKKYGKLLTLAKELEDAKNFKKVRGFVRVLENHCIQRSCAFDVDTDIDPRKVRMLLFEHGFVTSKSERDRVLEYAARYFNTTPDVVERAMYADRDEELILTNFTPITPENLIRLYNLSLLQTTLFNALRLTFWISDNHKNVFRAIKRLGLMYDLYEDNGKMMVDVTGAASLIKMTRKYGVSFARLIPQIITASNWFIRAEILDFDRIYIMELDDRMRNLLPDVEEQVEHDSSLEEEFSRKMSMLGYEIEREPDVVKAGRYAFIPDFAVKLGEKKVYVEIAGFWTREYMEKKIEKIREASVPIIVIAREDFGEGGELVDDSKIVVKFTKNIPYGEVIKAIKRFREEKKIEGDVVELEGFAEVPEGYVLAGKYAVREELFAEIKKEIDSANPATLDGLREILQKYGLGESAISAFGYRVKWIGLGEARLERVDET
jgi:predicted nuclease of restriction endonuclease-like RecB superfamily